MQRYFVPGGQLQADRVCITGDDARHLAKVMRAEVGTTIICSNGANREVLAEVDVIAQGIVEARVVRDLPMDREAAVQVWIAQSLPKGDKLETVIQKCTELGASRFIPFLSQRTVVQYDDRKEARRLERWHKIAKEAAEQAHRNRVPLVERPFGWQQLMELIPQADLALLCYEQESGSGLRTLLSKTVAAASKNGRLGDAGDGHGAASKLSVLVLVGPEGGFTETEVEEAVAAGCHSVSLGKRILRTETAAMAALACILYEAGEMGG